MSEENEIKEVKQKNKFVELISNNKLVTALIFIIVILLAYFLIRISVMENDYENKITTMEKTHKIQIDSLKISGLNQTVKVFSWAVRSEMMRNNLEEVNNLFLAFVQEKGIRMIDLIDPESSKIILSTDKKNQGTQVTNSAFLNVTEQSVIKSEEKTYIVSPVMGINKMTGILVVSVE